MVSSGAADALKMGTYTLRWWQVDLADVDDTIRAGASEDSMVHDEQYYAAEGGLPADIGRVG